VNETTNTIAYPPTSTNSLATNKTAWLGANLAPVSEQYSERVKIPPQALAEGAALVAGVVQNSPAERAGLNPGYVITKFNESSVRGVADLISMIRSSEIGSKARLEFWVPVIGPRVSLVVLDETPAPSPRNASIEKKAWLGASLADVHNNLAEELHVPANLAALRNGITGGGALITAIIPNSPAAKANLEAGTVITEFNDAHVSRAEDIIKMVRAAEIGSTANLKIWNPDSGWTKKLVYLGEYSTNTNVGTSKTTPLKIADETSILQDDSFASPDLISEAFAKNPIAAQEYLKTRILRISGRVMEIIFQDVDKFEVGLITTTQKKPRVILTDNVKKPYGLIEKPADKNNTWQIIGSMLMLHSEWNIEDPTWRHRYYEQPGYVRKIIQTEEKPVIGIGEEIHKRIRFLKNTPNSVFFEIVK